MPCRQTATPSADELAVGAFTTEADCLNACKEGACCEGTTCSVKPACQCQGTGKTFKGVGTTCSPNPCFPVCGCCYDPASETGFFFDLALGKRPVFAYSGIFSSQEAYDNAKNNCQQAGYSFSGNCLSKCPDEKGRCFPAYNGLGLYCNPLP